MLDQLLIGVTNSTKRLSLLELVSELAEHAVYQELVSDLVALSEEEKETHFSSNFLYTTDNGDVHYTEEASDLFNEKFAYYENILKDLLVEEG